MLKYIIIGIVSFLLFLCLIYFFLIYKLRRINKRFFHFQEENKLLENNILIVYQPSRHKTINKIVEIIKEEIDKKSYGYKIHTLNNKDDNYSNYKYVIFVVPVYFGEIHEEIVKKLKDKKINNLIIIYNGLNDKSDNEDKLLKKQAQSKYSKIKVHTSDIELVRDFIIKEVN